MKILVICTNIYNDINKEAQSKGGIQIEEVPQQGIQITKVTETVTQQGIQITKVTVTQQENKENTWYYISGEEAVNNYDEYLEIAKEEEIDIILIHSGVEDRNLNKLRETAKTKQTPSFEILGFHTTTTTDDDKNICEKIKKQDESVIKDLRCKKDYCKEKIRDKFHDIVRLFSPMDIDFQGIAEIYKEKKEEAKEYFSAVLQDKNENYYKYKLGEARRLIESVKDIEEKVREGKGNEWWEIANILLGKSSETESPVYPLFEKLDELKKKAIKVEEIETFISYLNDLKSLWKPTDWKFDKCFEETIGKKEKYSFSNWLRALSKCLEELKKCCCREF